MIRPFTIKETVFVMMIGRSFLMRPYHIQKAIPIIKITSMNQEISPAFLSLMVFISCGTSEILVHVPAAIPMNWSFIYQHILFLQYDHKKYAVSFYFSFDFKTF